VTRRARDFAPVDCETVLAQTLHMLQISIAESGAKITHDPLPMVWADELQMGQLFQNLIGNALKFRGPEAPRVHISAECQGEHWCFTVQDNGIGLDPAQADYILGVFQRLHTRDEYPGIGLGLTICKKIVERHGGCISVESEPGHGATFYFTIPAYIEEVQ
jgi:light-regulated signal transduction histidine kinase (bacteriophytochrome)